MKPTILFFLILPFFSITNATSLDEWVLEIEKEGIRVYTQLNDDSPYKQVKVTTTINAPVERVLEVLLAFSRYKTWMHNVTESYLINQSDEQTYYVFTLEDAAWPMQNRYLVSRLNVEQNSSAATVHFRSVPNYIEKRTDAIQIKEYEGYWSLKDRPNQQCSLEYVLIQNPGGHVPPWLANFRAVENPFHTMVHLKETAESGNIRP